LGGPETSLQKLRRRKKYHGKSSNTRKVLRMLVAVLPNPVYSMWQFGTMSLCGLVLSLVDRADKQGSKEGRFTATEGY
jgi:hypothetical protein